MDVKLENLMLGNAPGRAQRELLKLGDFGFAHRVLFYKLQGITYSMAPFNPCRERITCGSLGYMAPEILGKQVSSPYANDVFAYGVSIYSMVLWMVFVPSFPLIPPLMILGENYFQMH